MAAPFPRWANTAMRLAVIVCVLGLVGVPLVLMLWMRTPYVTSEGVPVAQPVAFDHRHHVRDDGIDCRYCHYGVETGAMAAIPPTAVCMNCHNQVWPASPLLQVVRDSYYSARPISWRRVNALPDFVYFNHSIHIQKGVGCATCHGRVDEMAQTAKGASLTMGWCLDCHRDPAPNLRPRDQITNMDWQPSDQNVGARLAVENDVHPTTHCTTCHR